MWNVRFKIYDVRFMIYKTRNENRKRY